MSIIESCVDFVNKTRALIKFRKCKTVTLFSCPQTIKHADVTVEQDPANPRLFIGSDGATYWQQAVTGAKKVLFSDGQILKEGEIAYFKVEPIVWEMGNNVYNREEIKDRHGKIKDYKFTKTERVYFVAKNVLCKQGDTIEHIMSTDEEFAALGDERLRVIGTVAGLDLFGVGWKATTSPSSKRVKKATDFAMACGVTTKKGKAYHTMMDNGMCALPDGKTEDGPKKFIYGEVLYFRAKPETFEKKENI